MRSKNANNAYNDITVEKRRKIMDELMKLLGENPNMMSVMITGFAEQYKPLVYTICNEFFKMYKDFANNTEFTATVATARMNQYNAYVAVGFTKEEAMSLLLTDIRKIAELVEHSSKVNTNQSKSKQ